MRIRQVLGAMLMLAILSAFAVPDAEAVIKPGFRAGAYFDDDSGFIGGEVLSSFTDSWYFNPNVEYVFVDNGNLWTINFDFHYDLDTDTPFFIWLGAGPAIIIEDPDRFEGETDIGVNLFGGIGFVIDGTDIVPYIQPKVILSDDSRFALAFGVRF